MPRHIYIDEKMEQQINAALEESSAAAKHFALLEIAELLKHPVVAVLTGDMLDVCRAAFNDCIDGWDYDDEESLLEDANEFYTPEYIKFIENNGESILERASLKFEQGWDWETHLEYIITDWVKEHYNGEILLPEVR